jgi:hypothetical protein
MTTNPIALLVKKEMALDIIQEMRAGASMKDACAKYGIEERAFHNTIAKFPEIEEALTEHVKARVASLIDDVTEDMVENARSLMGYSRVLRDRLDAGLLADGAAKTLMSIDKHNQKTLEILKPQIQGKINPPPTTAADTDAARANQILATMRGAKRVHADVTIEHYRVTLGGGEKTEDADIVDAASSDVPLLDSDAGNTGRDFQSSE